MRPSAAIALSPMERPEMYPQTYRPRSLLEALADLPQVARSTLLSSSANVYGKRPCGPAVRARVAGARERLLVTKLAMEYVASLYRTTCH